MNKLALFLLLTGSSFASAIQLSGGTPLSMGPLDKEIQEGREFYSRNTDGTWTIFQPFKAGMESDPRMLVFTADLTGKETGSRLEVKTNNWFDSVHDANVPTVIMADDRRYLADEGGETSAILMLKDGAIQQTDFETFRTAAAQLLARDFGPKTCPDGIPNREDYDYNNIRFEQLKRGRDGQFTAVVNLHCDLNDDYQGVFSLSPDLQFDLQKSKLDTAGSILGYWEPGTALSNYDETYLMESGLTGSWPDSIRAFEIRKLGTHEVIGGFSVPERTLIPPTQIDRTENHILDTPKYWVILTGQSLVISDKKNPSAIRTIPFQDAVHFDFVAQIPGQEKIAMVVMKNPTITPVKVQDVASVIDLASGKITEGAPIPGALVRDVPFFANGHLYFTMYDPTVEYPKLVASDLANLSSQKVINLNPKVSPKEDVVHWDWYFGALPNGELVFSYGQDYYDDSTPARAETFLLSANLGVDQEIEGQFIRPLLVDGETFVGSVATIKNNLVDFEYPIRERFQLE